MTYSPQNIASWFIKKSDKESLHLDQMKLMKLVYIAQGVALACDLKLFDESIEAWKYGPVIPTLYHQFKYRGTENITPSNSIVNFDSFCDTDFDLKTENILKSTWDFFKNFSGIQLSNWTHEQDSPWFREWHENLGCNKKNHKMDNRKIAEYFKKIISRE